MVAPLLVESATLFKLHYATLRRPKQKGAGIEFSITTVNKVSKLSRLHNIFTIAFL